MPAAKNESGALMCQPCARSAASAFAGDMYGAVRTCRPYATMSTIRHAAIWNDGLRLKSTGTSAIRNLRSSTGSTQ